MLVGDHGRVIPFRHFKALTVAVAIVLILSLGALTLLGFLHVQLRRQIADLQKSLEDTRAQTAKFRDEKDLYLTQLIALKKQNGELSQNPPEEEAGIKENGSPETAASEQKNAEEEKQEPEQVEKQAPVVKTKPEVQWSADIRNFKVSYDNRQQILEAAFRIYNMSKPKKTLSGRTVVVFKALDDPPIHWATVPVVPLRDGKPTGKNGKSFRINNYRTEHFKTLRGKYSAEYNTASIYIFTHQGELIANKEMAFNVDYSPPAPVKAAKPEQKASTPEESKKTAAPVTVPNEQTAPAEPEPVGSTAPGQANPDAAQQAKPPAPADQSIKADPLPLPDNGAQEPKDTPESSNNPATIENGSSSQAPATNPQPAAVGEQK